MRALTLLPRRPKCVAHARRRMRKLAAKRGYGLGYEPAMASHMRTGRRGAARTAGLRAA